MRSYQESADPNRLEDDVPQEATISKTIEKYRTWIGIAAVLITFLSIVVITSGSGKSGRPEGGKVPRVAVIVADGLNPAALKAAMASNKAPNLQGLTGLGSFGLCEENAACPTSAGLQSILNGDINNTVAPSFLKLAKDAKKRPAIIAADEMFSDVQVGPNNTCVGTIGAFDAECKNICASNQVSCNRETKFAYSGNGLKGGVFDAFVDAAVKFSEVIFMNVHGTQLAGAQSAFTEKSLKYLSNIYLLDSLVGNILTIVRDRAADSAESWLVVVTSTNGGIKGDDTVPLFVAAFDDGAPLALAPLSAPVSSVDVFPTVMKWLGKEHAPVQGKVQGICSNGILPAKNC